MSESIELGGAVAPELRKIVTAGFLRRAVGAIIDALIFTPLLVPIFAIPKDPNALPPDPLELALFYAVALGYGTLMLGRYGWTVGMRVVKVRVTQSDGATIGYKGAALRTFAYQFPGIAASVLHRAGWVIAEGSVGAIWVAAVLWMIVDRHHRAYHDKIAGTFVVRGVRAAAEAPSGVAVTVPAGPWLRAGKWAAFVTVSLVAMSPYVAVITLDVAAARAEQEVQAILAELKAEGKPVTAADLAPPPVPDAENAALVYEEAFEKLQLSKGGETVLSKVATNWRRGVPLGHEVMPEELDILAAGKGPLGPPSAPPGVSSAPPLAKGQKGMESKGKVPGPIVPEKVGPIEKVGPGEKGAPGTPSGWSIVSADPFMKVERHPGEPTDAQVVAAAEKALERNREALRLIRKAAAMQRCRLDIDWSKAINVLMPQMKWFRGLARLLELEAMALCEQGGADGALRTAITILDASDSLRSTPTLIALLTRVAVAQMGVAATQRVLFDSAPSPSSCRAAETRLSQIEFRKGLVRTLEGERAVHFDMFEAMKKGPKAFADLINADGSVDSSVSPLGERAWQRMDGPMRWWFTAEQLFFLMGMRLYVERATVPLFERDARPSAEWQQLQAQLRSPSVWSLLWRPRVLSAISLPVFDRPGERVAEVEAAVGLARTALLLKAYRGERGRYPGSLDELERYMGKELPLDPCSGNPFHYRLHGTGFILYSVGADGTDDGGKVAVRTGQEGPIPPLWSRESGSDIVWVCKR